MRGARPENEIPVPAGEPADGRSPSVAAVYDDLRRLAGHYLDDDAPDHTLQPTALAHEAYLRLVRQRKLPETDSPHFICLAASAMRSVLVDHARGRQAVKRGADARKLRLIESDGATARTPLDLVMLDVALAHLFVLDPRIGSIVELRFFAGLSVEEIAEVFGVSPRTVRRDWQLAKAWLRGELEDGKAHDA